MAANRFSLLAEGESSLDSIDGPQEVDPADKVGIITLSAALKGARQAASICDCYTGTTVSVVVHGCIHVGNVAVQYQTGG